MYNFAFACSVLRYRLFVFCMAGWFRRLKFHDIVVTILPTTDLTFQSLQSLFTLFYASNHEEHIFVLFSFTNSLFQVMREIHCGNIQCKMYAPYVFIDQLEILPVCDSVEELAVEVTLVCFLNATIAWQRGDIIGSKRGTR